MALWQRARCAWTVGFALAACTTVPVAPDGGQPFASGGVTMANTETPLAAPLPARPPTEWVQRIETRSSSADAGLIDLTVQSLQPLYRLSETDDALFTQIRMAGKAQLDNPSAISNIGIGYRRLIEPDLLAGVNGFYDRDWVAASHRVGADAELKWRALDFTINTYLGLDDEDAAADAGHALDGYDLKFATQLPHLPWAQAEFSTRTFFTAEDEDDRTGYATGIRLGLVDGLQFSAGVRGAVSIDQAGYVGLTWRVGGSAAPGNGRYLLSDAPIAPVAFEPRELSRHLLDKVKRIEAIERSF